jgi:hypothetical protein
LVATFRHNARITTARIGDFDRPLYPFIARAASAIIAHAAEQTTGRFHPARPRPTSSPLPWSFDAEVRAIAARYAGAIEEARRSGKPSHEIDGIIRGLRHQQAQEIRAMRRRRREEAAQRRAAREALDPT